MTLYYLYFSDVHYVCYVFLQQEHIYKLMKSDSYSRFIRSSAYQELLQAKKKVKKTNIFWCKLWKNAWQGSACLKVKFYLFTLRLFTVGDVETCPAGTRSHIHIQKSMNGNFVTGSLTCIFINPAEGSQFT